MFQDALLEKQRYCLFSSLNEERWLYFCYSRGWLRRGPEEVPPAIFRKGHEESVLCGRGIKPINIHFSQVHQRHVLEDHETVSKKIMTEHIDFSAILA